MIEQPLLTKQIVLSKENISEVLRRMFHKYRTVMNPRNKFTVTKEQYDSYYKFAIIRNPWARAYSWYKNVMRDEIHRRRHEIHGELSLDEFLRLYAGKGALRPQTYWIKDFSGSIPLDFIGRFETLVEDFEEACEAMHIPHVALPYKIPGPCEDYRMSYDQDSRKLVADIYREEIEMFGYSFSG